VRDLECSDIDSPGAFRTTELFTDVISLVARSPCRHAVIVDPIEERPSARNVFRVVDRANSNPRCSRNRKKALEVDVKA
jgi:hypothetical protein